MKALPLLLTAVLFASPAPSAAQSTVSIMFRGTCANGDVPCDPPRILQVDAEQGRVTATAPIACAGTALRATADGRYLVWNESCSGVAGQLRALDLVSGAQLPLGPAPPTFQVHPSELRVLFPEGPTIVSLTAAGRTTVPASGCPGGPFTLSGDGSRLLQTCPSGYVVRTTATGAVVRTIPFTGFEKAAVLDERGAAAYVLRSGTLLPYVQFLSRIDVASGAESVARQSTGDPIQGFGAVAFDRRTARAVVATSGWIEMFDGVSLTPVSTFRAGITFSPPPAFHPTLSRAYAWGTDVWPAQVFAVDVDRRTALGSAQLASDQDRILGVTVAPHPPAPATPVAVVAGRRVTLTWTPDPRSPILSGFELEVGSTAGAANLLRTAVAGTSLVADNVAPGTYFVRVRARNLAGLSAPSGDAQVVVP